MQDAGERRAVHEFDLIRDGVERAAAHRVIAILGQREQQGVGIRTRLTAQGPREPGAHFSGRGLQEEPRAGRSDGTEHFREHLQGAHAIAGRGRFISEDGEQRISSEPVRRRHPDGARPRFERLRSEQDIVQVRAVERRTRRQRGLRGVHAIDRAACLAPADGDVERAVRPDREVGGREALRAGGFEKHLCLLDRVARADGFQREKINSPKRPVGEEQSVLIV